MLVYSVGYCKIFCMKDIKNKSTESETMTKTHITETSPMYRVTDLYNHEGFIYYEVYKMGLSKDKKELDETNDTLLLSTYNKDDVNKYMNKQ